MDLSFLVLVVIITALVFDFTNGFHDTANAMATSIATGALRPKVAVLICAVLNIVGAFLSTEVAKTISSGLVDDTKVTPAVIFGGLIGAVLWNLTTWLFGLPSSSSHALFGGLIGAVWVGAGTGAVHFDVVVEKILVPAVASPLVCGVVALVATYSVYRITRRARAFDSVDRGFKYGQTVSASLVSLAHGTGDAQKTMGIITLVLITSGNLDADSGPPVWVILSAGLAIGLGTYMGGWRIIRTMGKGLTDVEPPQGFAAETVVDRGAADLGPPRVRALDHAGRLRRHPRLGSGPQARARCAGRSPAAWRWPGCSRCRSPRSSVGCAGKLAGSGNLGVLVVGLVAVAAIAGDLPLLAPQPGHGGQRQRRPGARRSRREPALV